MNTVVIIVLVILVLAGVGYIFLTYSTGGTSSFTQANGSIASGAQKFSKLGTPWSAPVPMTCKGTFDCSFYDNDYNNCVIHCSNWVQLYGGKTSCLNPRNSCSDMKTEASCKVSPGCSWS